MAGLGTRRPIALAIERLSIPDGAIVLVDEIEHGLEPHRIRHALKILRASVTATSTQKKWSCAAHLEPRARAAVEAHAAVVGARLALSDAGRRPRAGPGHTSESTAVGLLTRRACVAGAAREGGSSAALQAPASGFGLDARARCALATVEGVAASADRTQLAHTPEPREWLDQKS
jgi:hypothetical protein